MALLLNLHPALARGIRESPSRHLLFRKRPEVHLLSCPSISRTLCRSSIFVVSSSVPTSSPTVEALVDAADSTPDRTRLIAQNIPWTCTSDDIQSLFEQYGTVVDVELSMYNKIRNRGLAFVTMGSEEEALQALTKLESYELDGRVIKVEYSRSLKKKSTPPSKAPIIKYNVFVGNLAWRVRSSDLKELFGGPIDTLLSAEIVYQTKPRRPAGYGFVSFSSKEAAEAAISAFNGKSFMGRPLIVGFSKLRVSALEDCLKEQEQREVTSTEATEEISVVAN
ncbi:RNA-binding protein CP33, chloroplastic [Aristolochia californica]|uniref:RNA-binding protein CP33, chloroplastic n=1 Tax=Aristolochia californica TaxID=171875 RepID=UPI0035D80511